MAITSITAGTPTHANNPATITPTNPSHTSGNLLLCIAFARSASVTFSCATGSGWDASPALSAAFGTSSVGLFFNTADSAAEPNPVITVTGGASNVTVSAVVIDINGGTSTGASRGGASNNAAAANIAFAQDSPSIDNGNAILAIAHKIDDWTSVAVISGATAGVTWGEAVDASSTLGSDHGIAVDYAINSSGSAYTAGTGGSIAVTGGTSVSSLAFYVEIPAASVAKTITAAVGSYTLTGTAAGLLHGSLLTAAVGSYALTGQTVGLSKGKMLTAAVGAYSLSDVAAGLTKTWRMPAAVGSYALTGQAATLLKGKTLTAAVGSYVLTGTAASLLKSWRIPAAVGSYTLSGTAAALKWGHRLPANVGSYTLTGTATAFRKGWRLPANVGAYSLSGTAAVFLVGRRLAAAMGSYSLTGVATLLKAGRLITATAGSYALSGQNAALSKTSAGVLISAAPGTYLLTWIGVEFTIAPAPPPRPVQYSTARFHRQTRYPARLSPRRAPFPQIRYR